MQHVTQQRNFGKGRVINMRAKVEDIDTLIDDIKQGNVQCISWEIILKLLAELAKYREQEKQNEG